MVHSAGLQDGLGGYQTLQKFFEHIKRNLYNRWCRLKLIWGDGAYASIVEKVRKNFGWLLEIVLRSDTAKGFVVLATSLGRGAHLRLVGTLSSFGS